jgi:ABC-2 type transport system ATP-binding protein/lipopolysaccharide transport system ATP-binding protein
VTEPAIVVENASKRFRLYKDRSNSLKEAITRRTSGRYEDFWAVRDVSLSIPAGSTFGLIGHNGSGKSSLLRLMAGIHPPTSGTVASRGRISALLELGAGFHPDLSGRENVYLNGSILGLSRREVNALLDDIVSFSGLEDFIDAPVKVYSSGMYVRLGFAVAVHVKPEILMIDEVIAVGDEEFQRRCFEHLYKLRREGATIVLVSHAHGLLQSMCDEVAWMDHGRLMESGEPAGVIRHYLAQVNELEGARLAHEELNADAPIPAGRGSDGSGAAQRLGSGELRITRLELLGNGGQPLPALSSGDPAVFRICYSTSGPIESPVFSLGLNHETDVHLTGTNTSLQGLDLGTIEGDGFVDYVIERLPLLPGRYRVNAAVHDKHLLHPFDLRVEFMDLHVQPGSCSDDAGLVTLGGHWASASADQRSSVARDGIA